MISDGIENCLAAADKFDPTKSTNPFAYYTQIVYFAFIRRIQKEKKQQATKYKIIENLDLEDLLNNETDLNEFNNQFLDYMKKQLDQVDIEKRIIKKPKNNVLAEEIDTPIDNDN
jgi:DNA-directed RNA polymerase specialized sigma24 family protein